MTWRTTLAAVAAVAVAGKLAIWIWMLIFPGFVRLVLELWGVI